MPIDFNKIKSLFIEEDPNAPQPKPAEVAVPTATAPVAPSAKPVGAGQVHAKFLEVLTKAMEAANQPGVDYLEYRQSLQSLEKMPMDEAVRFQSAFAMAQAMGATPPKLLESAQHYLNVLQTEKAKFQDALRAQTAERVGNRQDMVKNLDATIGQKAEQITKLTKEIEQHRAEMEKLKAEVQDASNKVEATRMDFEASFAAMAGQISADLDKMKLYLK
jgi:chromosome segregation ATPase